MSAETQIAKTVLDLRSKGFRIVAADGACVLDVEQARERLDAAVGEADCECSGARARMASRCPQHEVGPALLRVFDEALVEVKRARAEAGQ